MPYVKLDTGMLNSTLWCERLAREVFITALLMAEPYYLAEETDQLQVRCLEPTGWKVPPGMYGMVHAAGPGIIHRALIDNVEAGKQALEYLGAPEEESRSREYEGRRMVRVNGGYIILNYFKYRDKDHTNVDRQRRYRDRRRAANAVMKQDNAVNVTDNAVTSRYITHADAEAEVQVHRTHLGDGTEEPIASPSAKRRRSAPREFLPTPEFEAFIAAYPRRQKVKDACKAWHQIAEPKPVEEIMEAVANQKRKVWCNCEKKHIPLPGTWLRAEQWDDEI